MSAITTKNLSKSFKIHKKEPGFKGSLQSIINRKFEIKPAVSNINLDIKEGELVGFIGPNGAGKTTTLKMLAGLIHPSTGEATVLGFTPWERKKEFLTKFSLVMGQKAQLWWDLPLYDSLLLQKDIYEIPNEEFTQTLEELTNLLDLSSFIKTQVRKLSLGQRMRAELAAAFIYKPKVLFLDEPTIGLDVVVQKKIREFIREYNKKHNATIILTSHDLDDVRQLCKRLIIIDHGKIAYDGATEDLITKHVDHKRISLTLEKPVTDETLTPFGNIISNKNERVVLHVSRKASSKIASEILEKLSVTDISIEEPSLEDVVRELFSGKDYA